MWGRLARWWNDVSGTQCVDCGLDLRDAKDAAYVWEEDLAVIAAAATLAASWPADVLLEDKEEALYVALRRRQERLDAR